MSTRVRWTPARFAIVIAVAIAASLASAQGAKGDGAASASTLALDVNRAIQSGVDALRRAQLADGSWPGQEAVHPGGLTALAGYTLVKSGVARQDDAVQRAYAIAAHTEFRSTYSHAVRLMFLDALQSGAQTKNADLKLAAAASLEFLVKNQDAASGAWAYPSGGVDMSNTQFALLGLRAANHLGLAIPSATLEKCAGGLLRDRDADGKFWYSERGGFKYWMNREATGGMTAAALAGFAVIRELGASSGEIQALEKKGAKATAESEAWLAQRFDVARNPVGERAWTPTFHFAYLWAIERWCGLTERKLLGGRDWYAEGARWLVEQQKSDGNWGAWIDDTCFALLFLRRATVTQGGEALALAPVVEPEREVPAKPISPRAGVAYLADWWLAGPFACKGEHAELASPPFDPSKLRPKEHQKLWSGSFERVALDAHAWSDLEKVAKHPTDQALWVLATEISNSTKANVDGVLWLTLEDGWSAWFDGRRVSFDQRVMAPIEENVRVPLAIAPGAHSLVILVEDAYGVSAFGARLVDDQGQTLSAIVCSAGAIAQPAKSK